MFYTNRRCCNSATLKEPHSAAVMATEDNVCSLRFTLQTFQTAQADLPLTCYWFDSMILWNGLDPCIASSTYLVFHSYFQHTDGTQWSISTPQEQIALCNARAPVACLLLMTAFRLVWKYIDDYFDSRLLSEMCTTWVDANACGGWHVLEEAFLKSIDFRLYNILDNVAASRPGIFVPHVRKYKQRTITPAPQ
jgi:hypothetical protein